MTTREPALALHCMMAHGGAWKGVRLELEDRLTLATADLPGHGANPPWAGGEDFLDVAVGQIAPLLDRPLHLIGHSVGGAIALRLALEHPDRVLTLTLVEPVLFATLEGDAFRAQRDFADTLTGLVAAGELEEAARRFVGIWGAGEAFDAVPERLRGEMLARIHIVPGQWPGLIHDTGGILAPGRLEAFDKPVLLVEGGDSPPAIAGILDGLGTRLPNAQRVVVPGAGHMVPITHPVPVAAAIRGLLDTQGGARPTRP